VSPPRILPKEDVLQLPDVPAMLAEDNDLYPVFLRTDKLRTEPLVLLGDVVAKFSQVLFTVDDLPRIVETHVVPDIQL
jgi:hypothetical protein